MKMPRFGALTLTAALSVSGCSEESRITAINECRQGVEDTTQALRDDTRNQVSGLHLVDPTHPVADQFNFRLRDLHCALDPATLDGASARKFALDRETAAHTVAVCHEAGMTFWWTAPPILRAAQQNARSLSECFEQIADQRQELCAALRLANCTLPLGQRTTATTAICQRVQEADGFCRD